MIIRTAVYNTLSGSSNLTGIVSTRIYFIKMPQSTIYPAVTFEMLPTSGRVHLMGADSVLAMETLRVTVWGEAKDFTNMETAAGYIKTLLQDFTGTMGGAGGISVERIFLETNQPTMFNAGVGVYQISQDFEVWYQEA